MAKKLSILLFLGLVTFTLWRNYGVVAKGDKVDLADATTNEQKELLEKVKELQPKKGMKSRHLLGTINIKLKIGLK